ncbi:PREDICTED: uncharacterized protein LOC106329980 [Brassica oleracea var. oleracea]|uniref:GRF-type domain-containing protein n=1 Tax=Brassica oleracea var. oleracea TaxID=109376 RepID=A0A0D3B719_BRAOL|nr:PREDICTED: uncharacterized protein LOC106329980 [Brassica oleracea var. oleracea]
MCFCGEGVIELISKSDRNPYRRYYRSLHAAQRRLVNDNHVFKWVDEAFKDEIQQLDNQVHVLEEELQPLKTTMRIEGPNNGRIVGPLSISLSSHITNRDLRIRVMDPWEEKMNKKEKKEKKKMNEHFDKLGYVTDAHYGIPIRFPCGERFIDEVSLKPKYPTYFDTFPGIRYFPFKNFENDSLHFRQPWVFGVHEEVQRLRKRMNKMADEIEEIKELMSRRP